MPLTSLDPRTALIIIDLQKGLSGYPTLQPIAEVTAQAAALAQAFRAQDQPVVLVNVAGTPPGRREQTPRLGELPPDFADLLPGLGQQPQDRVITKRTPGAFADTSLEADLRALGVTQVVVCGVATSMGVEATARHAFELGFNVVFAVDAMTDVDAEVHANSLERIFPRIGERATTDEIVSLLGDRRP